MLIIPLFLYRFRKDVIFYINTQLPFCAAIAGKLTNKRIIYHLHENYLNPGFGKKLASRIKKWTATKAICVSGYLADNESDIKDKVVVYNSLAKEYIDIAEKYLKEPKPKEKRNILMVSSLKPYKGIFQFIRLAKEMPDLKFFLVAGARYDEVEDFKKKNKLPDNLILYHEQSAVHIFYQMADILLNLSLTDLWQETFGMTILESMYYGLPVIVPPVGGQLEMISDGINGYVADSRDIDFLKIAIRKILSDEDLYNRLSFNALKKAKEFSEAKQIESILNVIRSI